MRKNGASAVAEGAASGCGAWNTRVAMCGHCSCHLHRGRAGALAFAATLVLQFTNARGVTRVPLTACATSCENSQNSYLRSSHAGPDTSHWHAPAPPQASCSVGWRCEADHNTSSYSCVLTHKCNFSSLPQYAGGACHCPVPRSEHGGMPHGLHEARRSRGLDNLTRITVRVCPLQPTPIPAHLFSDGNPS